MELKLKLVTTSPGGWVLQNFSSLAGLEVTEKFDLIYFFGWPGGWVAGWLEKVELRLTSALV